METNLASCRAIACAFAYYYHNGLLNAERGEPEQEYERWASLVHVVDGKVVPLPAVPDTFDPSDIAQVRRQVELSKDVVYVKRSSVYKSTSVLAVYESAKFIFIQTILGTFSADAVIYPSMVDVKQFDK